MSISLYNIEAALAGLMTIREFAEAEGDSEAVTVVDQQIREYLKDEAVKVTNYTNLIRNELMSAEACDAEAERFADIAKRKRSNAQRLKDLALEAMQAFGVKELKATPGGGLRRQANGGLQSLDIIVDLLPAEFRLVTATMNQDTFSRIAGREDVKIESLPVESERIREALKYGVKIRGATLLPRGEHVRVI